MTVSISPYLQHLLDTRPGLWGCKDAQSNYIYVNRAFSVIAGLQHNGEIAGLADSDLPCNTEESARLFRAQDGEVIRKGQALRILDIHGYPDATLRYFITTKAPLRNAGQQIVGTIFHCRELNSVELIKLGTLLNQTAYSSEVAAWLASGSSHTINHPDRRSTLSPRALSIILRED
ncbi:MAG: PAS domain-containing protein [Paludibacterium sp.]|uniref:PAS domain-containing protein n=1 Tax=Paludibacterium sp. TaxID=1917523 RepID=UPI0025D9034B|nr:PAS domain-containing protein [Paludibacterium sp.]MBV8047473.1 PAS domain-containing protein [Paludibacterium sp.]MBV8646729.1 PAS domain-containing protein [Paludibacterium sp.]